MADFDFSSAREALRLQAKKIYRPWDLETVTIMGGMGSLVRRFYAYARLMDERDHLMFEDVATALKIVGEIKSPSWNHSCVEHSIQVGVLARTIGESLLPGLVDPNRMEVMGLLHDLGRCVSHDAWIHGLAGERLLKYLGFGQDIADIAYLHLEAGAPLLGATPKNWPQILEAENLQAELDHLPLTAVIIAVADMAKKSVEEPAGSGRFVNRLCDPLEGVFVSGLRRLSRERAAALTDINPLKISGRQLRGLYKLDSKMGMYLGLCWLFRKKLVSCGVVFEGEDGVIAKAKMILKRMQTASSPGS